MVQHINNAKIKSTKAIIISVAVIILSVSVVIVIIMYGLLNSFSGSSIKDKLSSYDNKTYSITSEDGKIQGFVATKIVSIGEFPSDMALKAYYNILIKDPLAVQKGTITFGNVVGDKGYLQPVYCDADISKINPFNYYDAKSFPFKCETELSTDMPLKSFYSSYVDSVSERDLKKQFPNIGVINVYDIAGSSRKLLKTYQVSIQKTN